MNKPHVLNSINSEAKLSRLFTLLGRSLNVIDMDHGLKITRHCYSASDIVISVQEMTNAGLKGKTCKYISIHCDSFQVVRELMEEYFYDLALLFKAYATEEHASSKYKTATIYSDAAKSIDTYCTTFSPMNVQPLKTLPKRWNIRTACQALIAGQFANLECTGRYTDDYAFDAADNYGKGSFDAEILLADILNGVSGWKSYLNDAGTICTVKFYGNETYKFRLNLKQLKVAA